MTKNLRKLFASIILLILTAVLFFFISKSKSFQLFGDIYPKVSTSEKIIALTFDDGPSKKTDLILDILNNQNVKATFS